MITRRQFIGKLFRIISAISLAGGGLYLSNKNKESSECTQTRCTDCNKSDSCINPLAMSWRNKNN
jgi:hypothetical protein